MDEDFELGNSIKDDLIPLALEYFLGVIEQADSDEEDEDDDDDDEDSDGAEKKKKKSKKPEMPAGAAEMTPQQQQECKQQ